MSSESEGPLSHAYVRRAGLHVDATLAHFIEHEALSTGDLTAEHVWNGLSQLLERFAPDNRALLERRESMQRQIDRWHREHAVHDPDAYRRFLEGIGYIEPLGPAFTIETASVDAEIASLAGPQLVVPATNARYALNAANARWGSLYDALYGTDALGDLPPPGDYDAARGERVVRWTKEFLDDVVPLSAGSHCDAVGYRIAGDELVADLSDGSTSELKSAALFAGWLGEPQDPASVIFEHHGLHIELVVDRRHPVGATDPAGVADVVLEAALTSIIDIEDSVAAVDGPDKTVAYRNWLGLMRGTLTAEVAKGGATFLRSLAPERVVRDIHGGEVTLSGRALLMVRNVGHLMTTPAVLDAQYRQVPEGLLDAFVTVLCARDDALGRSNGTRNSQAGSIYVVKPKMHGSDEVRFTDEVFDVVEDVLGLPRHTVKLGIMDEERRTSVNLLECIRAARHRVAFINTGFLDRTGDEIHTCMHAGPVVRKADMKTQSWLSAYENQNVAAGLFSGFRGRAQIGKGMWAAPDRMADMIDQKIAHPTAGASCAWVPSPTAATLHAIHYHRVDVAERQEALERLVQAHDVRTDIGDLLTPPVEQSPTWTAGEITSELDNNIQGILGYVVRWIDQGIGCSKVPDIHDVGLMEDRATCRISSQHIANWIVHGIVTVDQVDDALRRMAQIVDRQNAGDMAYRPMAPDFDGVAFNAARDLILDGAGQPSGYTEPILHARRTELKEQREAAR